MKSRLLSIAIIFLILYQIEGEESRCGTRIPDRAELITGKNKGNEVHWPWHAAIYYVEKPQKGAATEQKNSKEYICGGSLIDSKSILTAAHCVYKSRQRIEPENVIVFLGKLNLNVTEYTSQSFNVTNIIEHPNYTSIDLINDIAILRLSTEAIINTYVRPVCLWDSNKLDLSEVIGKNGTVIGWGVTDTDELSNILHQAVMPVVDSDTCRKSNRNFYSYYLPENKFCAGFRNGISVCNGDSGGAMTFEEKEVFYIRGIASLTQARNDTRAEKRNLCNPNEYAVFTDVAKYLTWIRNHTTQQTNCEKKVNCHSFVRDIFINGKKSCNINLNISLPEGNCKIKFEEASDTEVTGLIIYGKVAVFPDFSDIFSKFENIVSLELEQLELTIVEKSKLTMFRRSSFLDLNENKISELAAETFDDLTNIKMLFLAKNRLRNIHQDLFKNLRMMKVIRLDHNQLETLPYGLFRNNRELTVIRIEANKLQTIGTDFKNLSKLYLLNLSNNSCIDDSCSGSEADTHGCIGESCGVKVYCDTAYKEELQSKIWRKCS